MVVEQSTPPAALREQFIETAHRVVWCALATVDRLGRPRSRVVHPVWERAGEDLVGWVLTRPTPLKLAHLERTPFVSCSYWDPRHDTAVAECDATWADPQQREHAWSICRALPAPAGHDPADIFPGGPHAPEAAVLRLAPWRLRVATAAQMAAGGAMAWRRASGARAAGQQRDAVDRLELLEAGSGALQA
jgi:hypothetical protein